jgi:hypothetical protein
MKTLFAIVFAVFSFVAVACSSGSSGQQICDRFSVLCPSGGDGGVTVTFKCDSAAADSASNKDDVKKCLDSAKDCNAALLCLTTLKK